MLRATEQAECRPGSVVEHGLMVQPTLTTTCQCHGELQSREKLLLSPKRDDVDKSM
jgi:hypothetical protein